MKYSSFLWAVLALLLLWNCRKEDPVPVEPEIETGANDEVIYTYRADDTDFPNPDRGFYRYTSTRASNYDQLNETILDSYKGPLTSFGANYSTVSTLIFRYFILDDFVDSPISQDFLTKMQEDFNKVRRTGMKIIPRFVYTIDSQSGDCLEGNICPPYGDAPKNIVLQHIQQLGPYLSDNADVITCLQMGFIGIWGENFYTDHFGGFDENGRDIALTDANWEDRTEVLAALLNELPDDMMVQVRYPQLKQRYLNGVNAPTSIPSISEEIAFGPSEAARIAFHNDCLLASESDNGTYVDFGNSSSPEKSDIEVLRNYQSQEGKFVIIGGETCDDVYSPQNDCSPLGIADQELREHHYTFLNADFNHEVNNDWQDGGCMDEIKKNLGYRFTVKKGTYPSEVAKGNILNVAIDIENSGYATPVRSRDVKLILKNSSDGRIFSFPFFTDIRRWYESARLIGAFAIPSDVPTGNYELYLHLADSYERIASVPEYSIRLANEDVWEESTGYNKLGHTIEVK